LVVDMLDILRGSETIQVGLISRSRGSTLINIGCFSDLNVGVVAAIYLEELLLVIGGSDIIRLSSI
jgi:hypothetical protein